MAKKLDPAIIEAEENLLIDFQFLLQEALNTKRVSLSELAERAGLSKSRISQMMGADANPTVKSMARLFHALGETLCLSRSEIVEASLAASPSPTQTWNWIETETGEMRIDDRLVAVVKDTAASNDNYAQRFVMIESELDVAA